MRLDLCVLVSHFLQTFRVLVIFHRPILRTCLQLYLHTQPYLLQHLHLHLLMYLRLLLIQLQHLMTRPAPLWQQIKIPFNNPSIKMGSTTLLFLNLLCIAHLYPQRLRLRLHLPSLQHMFTHASARVCINQATHVIIFMARLKRL